MKIRINPAFDAFHNASLFKAVVDTFGPGNISYTTDGPPTMDPRSMAFVVDPIDLKIVIDHLDTPRIVQKGIEWCDVYAKSNIDHSAIPAEHAGKVLNTGPCVPVRFCGPVWAMFYAAWTYVLSMSKVKRENYARTHISNWWRQYKYRMPEGAYRPEPCSTDYVFFSGTIWKSEPQCNMHRANFMEACRTTPGLKFEGGFMPRTDNDVPGFEKWTVPQHWTHRQYVANTKRSVVAFNTPSVFGCNPWRTAEFMGMAKAIIATPLLRDLPAPVKHGEQMHFVEGSLASIREAIQLIRKDTDYRQHLEQGALAYYQSYMRPGRIIERILEFAFREKPAPERDRLLREIKEARRAGRFFPLGL